MNFIDQLHTSLQDRQLLDHPFYRDWMEGKLSREMLSDYAHQYLPFVEAFPRFVSGVHNLCDDAQGRRYLLMNLVDEEGSSEETSHPALWKNFTQELDASFGTSASKEVREASDRVKEIFLQLSRRSYEEGLCALYTYEYQIPQIAEAKIQGLIERYGVDSPRALEFFEVHRQADVFHSRACAELIEKIPADKREAALIAAREAAEALWNFLTAVHAA